MGFEKEIFLTNIWKEYECPSCNQIAYPSRTTKCGHLFCEECTNKKLNEMNVCPECNTEDPQPQENPFVERVLNNCEVKCPNHCDFKGKLYELVKNHIPVCSLQIVQCSNNGCEFKTERKNLNDHLRVCDYRQVKCEYCDEQIIFKNVKVN